MLHIFGETEEDGTTPTGNVVLDKQGNLYGITAWGGSHSLGIVYAVNAAGQETVLHTFTSAGGDGAGPGAGLVSDAFGNFYSTTGRGGDTRACAGGCGTVFKISP